jgi:YHS domain-containing protein
MKTKIPKFRRVLAALIISVVVCLTTGAFVAAQTNEPETTPALEGLDPVLLVQGKEAQGNVKISVIRGAFQYYFANAENKAEFEKDPARYEIQLHGACARMGAPVNGNPDLYSVYKSRIYIFGSGECKKRFDATPAKYLESESGAQPKIELSPEALKKGQALIEKAVFAMGGSALIDGLVSYEEKSTTVQTRHTGNVDVKSDLTILFPGRMRLDQVMPDFMNPATTRKAALIIADGVAFAITANGTQQFADAFRIDQEREIQRRPLAILRARKNANFNAAAIGSASAGETTVEQVAVQLEGSIYTLGIDAATGRILSLSYRRRGRGGDFGQITKLFSDFRTIEALTLPFKVQAAFNGEAWEEQSAVIKEININSRVDPAIFEKPKTAKVQ